MKERWASILGHPNYEVSNLGRVRGVHGLITLFVACGYRFFRVYRGKEKPLNLKVHREVLRAFKGSCPNKFALHKDGNALNNHVDNLRWGDAFDNATDKKRHGREPQGEKHWNSRLKKRDILAIRKSKLNGVRAAEKYGISSTHVYYIRQRKTWAWLP